MQPTGRCQPCRGLLRRANLSSHPGGPQVSGSVGEWPNDGRLMEPLGILLDERRAPASLPSHGSQVMPLPRLCLPAIATWPLNPRSQLRAGQEIYDLYVPMGAVGGGDPKATFAGIMCSSQASPLTPELLGNPQHGAKQEGYCHWQNWWAGCNLRPEHRDD